MSQPEKWKYEADEVPKRKHAWNKSHAGFVIVRGVQVGKCPNGLSPSEAERLLNDGLSVSPKRWNKHYPWRIYVVHNGVLYRAKPTNPGVSYHAFPESARGFDWLPKDIRDQIFTHAQKLGQLKQVKTWVSA